MTNRQIKLVENYIRMKVKSLLKEGDKIRQLDPNKEKSELKWYFEKFFDQMEGSSVQTMQEWVEGINYGPDFSKKLINLIKKSSVIQNGEIYLKPHLNR